ncbi:hypothetical protein Nepgr_027845 [Nepenthes gracilis]|uniref:Bifunctional inhibitor/plant lipid transfer protein/seed storage helical domain-containing protein n=1 Tax=Nepenthes gracilis TaxID=150966 RepID=A0AAD3TAU3_NEPGR|nr:hypothetical protein Nepgr_027845 [Nepenthes gracilis]
MEITKIPVLLPLMAILLVVVPELDSQPTPETPPVYQPLCVTQLTLVNHACSVIPYTPLQPHKSTPPSSSPSHHHHHHRRHHEQRHHYHHTVEEQECCRWLRALDPPCVCDVIGQLPVFLSRPLHNYTIYVYEDCVVTYECEGQPQAA